MPIGKQTEEDQKHLNTRQGKLEATGRPGLIENRLPSLDYRHLSVEECDKLPLLESYP
jgi:hypothetical protein